MRFIYYCSFSLSLLDRPIRAPSRRRFPDQPLPLRRSSANGGPFPTLAENNFCVKVKPQRHNTEISSAAGLIPWAA
jgi:hypothetical protein